MTRVTTERESGPEVVLALPPASENCPAGFDGPIWQRLLLFVALGALTAIAALIPFPTGHENTLVAAWALFFLLTAAALAIPWRKVPSQYWLIIPISYMAVVGLLRDAHAEGGEASGMAALLYLPMAWIALYGRRWQIGAGLMSVFASLVIPFLAIGAPAYPSSEWRLVLLTTAVAFVLSVCLYKTVSRERAYVSGVAQQTLLAQQAAQRAFDAREQLGSLLAAATETAVIGVDPTGLVTFFSAGAERLLGYGADEVVGQRRVHDFVDPSDLEARGDELRQLLENAVDSSAAGIRESIWSYRRKDGARRHCAVTITARPGHGEPYGYVLVANDVTEREQLTSERERLLALQHEVTQMLVEQNHRLRELTKVKDDLVDTVSHELRTPLTAIKGFIELLLDGAGVTLDAEQTRIVQTIERNADHLLHVSEDLLADPGSRHDRQANFAPADLSALALEAVDSMVAAGRQRNVDLVASAPQPAVILGDPRRLHQLLANLLSNALKFAPAGGHVHLRVSVIGNFARLEVLDDGPGIPPDERPQLFERFYRLASTTRSGIPGAGLGLAIAKSVVDAHEGSIDIVDTPGWSTTVRVHFPLMDTHSIGWMPAEERSAV